MSAAQENSENLPELARHCECPRRNWLSVESLFAILTVRKVHLEVRAIRFDPWTRRNELTQLLLCLPEVIRKRVNRELFDPPGESRVVSG